MSGSKGASLKKFMPGDIIFKEGEAGHKIYIIKQGAIRIVAQKEDKTVTLGVLKNGACFGEMAVISSAPRVASAIADAPSELYEIDKEQVDNMIAALPPLFRAIVSSLIKRVTTLNNFAAEKSSIAHPISSMASLIDLLYQNNKPAPAPANNNMGMGLSMNGPGGIIDETEQEASVPIATIMEASHNILGYTESGTQKLLDKLVKLKLAHIGMKERKKQFTFKPENFVQDTRDLVQELGYANDHELTAQQEYIDLKDLAKQLGIKQHSLLGAIVNGRIDISAVVLKQSVVRRSIEEQGRQLF